jgi:hypothetical protein
LDANAAGSYEEELRVTYSCMAPDSSSSAGASEPLLRQSREMVRRTQAVFRR